MLILINLVFLPRSVDWALAAIAAIPYLLFTTINYVDYPLGSGKYLEDSAFCALLDINISPKVTKNFLRNEKWLYNNYATVLHQLN